MTNLPTPPLAAQGGPTDPFDSTPDNGSNEPPVFPSGGQESQTHEVVDSTPSAELTSDSGSADPRAEAPKKEPAPKKTSTRSSGLAFAGKPIDLEDLEKLSTAPSKSAFPKWNTNRIYDAGPTSPDFKDVQDLNRAVQNVRIAIGRVTNGLEIANRDLTLAEMEYRKAYAFAIIGVSGGTVGQREAFAEIKVIDQYDDLQVKKAVSHELSQRLRSLKFDLDGLQIIANNMRAEINLR